MALIVLSGIPGSGKTHLANNLKALFEKEHHECEIVHEPSVEDGAFSSTKLEIQGRSDFKAAVRRALSPEKVVIADGMNFIKGLRYELFCIAREQNLKYCVAFCDVDQDIARERIKDRYPEKNINDLFGRMETPNERNKWDKPLFVVKDANDQEIIESIKNCALSVTSRLSSKKATAKQMGNSVLVNDRIDKEINEFCNELLKVQANVPLGSKLSICGATYILKKQLNPGQLKRARREFADRAKTITDKSNIPQLFADSLQVLH